MFLNEVDDDDDDDDDDVQRRSMGRGRWDLGPPIILTGRFDLVSGHALHPALRFNMFISVQ